MEPLGSFNRSGGALRSYPNENLGLWTCDPEGAVPQQGGQCPSARAAYCVKLDCAVCRTLVGVGLLGGRRGGRDCDILKVHILPQTAHLRILVPKTIPGMVFGTGVLHWAVDGPFGMLRTAELHALGELPGSLEKPSKNLEYGARSGELIVWGRLQYQHNRAIVRILRMDGIPGRDCHSGPYVGLPQKLMGRPSQALAVALRRFSCRK